MCCQQKTASSVAKTRHSSFRTTHLPEPVAYLNHRRSDQGREHAPVNWLVHMPGLHSADEFMQRSLNRVKELQETHQSPLVLNITVRDAASSCLRGAEARPT